MILNHDPEIQNALFALKSVLGSGSNGLVCCSGFQTKLFRNLLSYYIGLSALMNLYILVQAAVW